MTRYGAVSAKIYLVRQAGQRDSGSTVPERPKADVALVAAGEHLLDLIASGRVTGMAFIVFLAPNSSGRVGFEADVLGDVKSHRLLALGACEELKDLVTK